MKENRSKSWYGWDEWTFAVVSTGRCHEAVHLVRRDEIEWRVYDKKGREFARFMVWDGRGWIDQR